MEVVKTTTQAQVQAGQKRKADTTDRAVAQDGKKRKQGNASHASSRPIAIAKTASIPNTLPAEKSSSAPKPPITKPTSMKPSPIAKPTLNSKSTTAPKPASTSKSTSNTKPPPKNTTQKQSTASISTTKVKPIPIIEESSDDDDDEDSCRFCDRWSEGGFRYSKYKPKYRDELCTGCEDMVHENRCFSCNKVFMGEDAYLLNEEDNTCRDCGIKEMYDEMAEMMEASEEEDDDDEDGLGMFRMFPFAC